MHRPVEPESHEPAITLSSCWRDWSAAIEAFVPDAWQEDAIAKLKEGDVS